MMKFLTFKKNIRSNSIGWKLDEIKSRGYIIRKPISLDTIFSETFSLLGVLIFAFYVVYAKSAIVGAVLGLLLSLYISFWAWNAQLFLNTKKKLCMDGHFCDRFKFNEAMLRSEQKEGFSQLWLVNKINSKMYLLWESHNVDEVNEVEEFLKNVLFSSD